MYTCPTGKRAIVTYIIAYNTAGTSTTILPKLKRQRNLLSNRRSCRSSCWRKRSGFEFKRSDFFPNNIRSWRKDWSQYYTSWMNLFANIMEFDNTAPNKDKQSGKHGKWKQHHLHVSSREKGCSYDQWIALNLTLKKLYYFNNSGSSKSIVWYAVPNGGSTGSTNQLQPKLYPMPAVISSTRRRMDAKRRRFHSL